MYTGALCLTEQYEESVFVTVDKQVMLNKEEQKDTNSH